MIHAAGMAAVLALAPAAAPPTGPWILTCDMAAPSDGQAASPSQRVFRIAPRVFQEWSPDSKRFGPNLCAAYSCARAPGRLEGTISSSTLNLTISLDLATRRGAWRTEGASGLSRTSGACAAKPEQPRPQTGPSPARPAPAG
jgi:hypothetical protein